MTDIIELARKAGGVDINSHGWTSWVGTKSTEFLERFSALVRAERDWVDLTDDEIEEIGKSYFDEWSFGFARAVIAADREKNK